MKVSGSAVKICGISTFEIYRHCAEIGVDWIGMVFFAKSPRHLELRAAAELAMQADEALAYFCGSSLRKSSVRAHGQLAGGKIRNGSRYPY